MPPRPGPVQRPASGVDSLKQKAAALEQLVKRKKVVGRSLSGSADNLPLELEEQIDRLCDDFEKAWRDGQQPRIEDYLTKLADVPRKILLARLLEVELELL